VPDIGRPYALFRVAAGPRLGFGHLRRATVLAGTLGATCALSVRGAAAVRGHWRPAPSQAVTALRSLQPRLLVIDDPHEGRARPWLRAARELGIPCASLHDIGLAPLASDLAVDGSLGTRRTSWPARAVLQGPAFAVIGLGAIRRASAVRTSHRLRVVVSLGGGRHPRHVVAITRALRMALPDATLVVPAGLHGEAVRQAGVTGLHLVDAPDGLGPVLAGADLAVLGGGVSLYEAAALGIPTVTVPVVPAQEPTVRAFVRRGLAVTVPRPRDVVHLGQLVARRVRLLAQDAQALRRMRARGPAIIDGRGAERVAQAFRQLVEARHA
jgi:spore coat polysaccharide biosynthesis predicted glycosyltransferase SpsG